MNQLINELCVFFGAHGPFWDLPRDNEPLEAYFDRCERTLEWRRIMKGAALDIVNANQPVTGYKPWLRIDGLRESNADSGRNVAHALAVVCAYAAGYSEADARAQYALDLANDAAEYRRRESNKLAYERDNALTALLYACTDLRGVEAQARNVLSGLGLVAAYIAGRSGL